MQIKAPLTERLQSLLATSNYGFLNEPCKVKMTFHDGSILVRIATYSHHVPNRLESKFAFLGSLAYFVMWAEVNNDNGKLI